MARRTPFALALRPLRFLPLLWVTLAAASCGSDDSPAENPGGDVDAGSDVAEATDAAASDSASGADSAAVDSEVAEASADVAADSLPLEAGAGCEEKAKSCAATFGTLFTKANGRADGTLVALVWLIFSKKRFRWLLKQMVVMQSRKSWTVRCLKS